MNAPILTDAAVTRMIRRILAAPTTISDTLLVIADGLEEAVSHTAEADAAAMLTLHAANLRHMAPYFAQKAQPAPPPCIDPARALLLQHPARSTALRNEWQRSDNLTVSVILAKLADAAAQMERGA